MKGYNSWTRY